MSIFLASVKKTTYKEWFFIYPCCLYRAIADNIHYVN